MSIRTLLVTAACAGLLVGCGTDEPAQAPDPADPVATPIAATLNDGAPGDLKPGPAPGERDRRRMDIDQLDASIRQVTGGIGWTVNGVNQFEALSATLGKPDYQDSTEEDLAPSLLFQKFLGDASSSVCTQLAAVDATRAEDERALFIHVDPTDTLESNPDGIEANLSALLLRYHGRTMAPGADRLDAWRWLFESTTHLTGDPAASWRAVCVGLLMHPDFYSY